MSEINSSRYEHTPYESRISLARVEPNVSMLPDDTKIWVTTESEDYHILRFGVHKDGPHSTLSRLFLEYAEPPLEGVYAGKPEDPAKLEKVHQNRQFWIKGELVRNNGQVFELLADEPYLAKTAFRAVYIEANVRDPRSPLADIDTSGPNLFSKGTLTPLDVRPDVTSDQTLWPPF